MLEPLPPPPSRFADALKALILAAGFGAPAVLGLGAVGGLAHPLVGVLVGLVALVALTVAAYRATAWKRRVFTLLFEVLVLGVLPCWGLAYSHFAGYPTCRISSCQVGETAFRPFAEPEVLGLVALHALTVLAYAVSRRRPAALVPVAEGLVHAALVAGILAHAVIAVHVARWLPASIALAPVFLPCASPLLTVALYTAELRARLVRRGTEAAATAGTVTPDSPYREGPPQEPLPEPRLHRAGLGRALALGPALLGVHAVLHAIWLGRPDAALEVFTRTCGHVLSSIPIDVVPENCHYLCTVAARGHASLVRPERLGRRGGVLIVVNRQLALANAFEDLLHERWPRFGRAARRGYDRVGLPVSRLLRRRWLSDLVYLAMKPAEWAFYVALLLLDRGEPEARIDRMYR